MKRMLITATSDYEDIDYGSYDYDGKSEEEVAKEIRDFLIDYIVIGGRGSYRNVKIEDFETYYIPGVIGDGPDIHIILDYLNSLNYLMARSTYDEVCISVNNPKFYMKYIKKGKVRGDYPGAYF